MLAFKIFLLVIPIFALDIFPPVTDVVKQRVSTTNIIPSNVIKFDRCDVPCWFHPKNMPLVGSKTVYDDVGRKTVFMHSMEGSKHYRQIKTIKPGVHDALSTTSFESEVPLPYFSWAEYSIQNTQVDFNNAIKGAVFIARNCGSINEREKLVKKLQQYIRVDSISSCLGNSPWPTGIKRNDKNAAMRRYLFYLSFENEISRDYITEKLWGGLESGTLPIYYGAPNVHEHAPPMSIIQVSHETVDTVGPLLQKLTENKEEYDKYHLWRKKPLTRSFIEKYHFTHTHGLCRSCRYNKCRHDPSCKWDQKNQKGIYN
jgi:hypothetical protein